VAASANRICTSRGAHVAAIDPIDRAGFALDPARDFQGLRSFMAAGAERSELSIVHHHFGVVARRTVAGTGKDHRVHVGGAQRFVARSRPSPSATPRPGWICRSRSARPRRFKPGSIMKSVGSTNDLKPWRRRRVSFMGTILCWQGANLHCRDNTIEGNVGVWGESLPRLIAGDNGEAGAGGQPARGLFPRLLRGLRGGR